MSRAGVWEPLLPGTADLCAALPDGSAVLTWPQRIHGVCTQAVFAEGELHVPAEVRCGAAAAAPACLSGVEERERFFSFGIVRLYRLDNPTAVAPLVPELHLHKRYSFCQVCQLLNFSWLYQPKIASCFSLSFYLSQKEINTVLVRFVSHFSEVFFVQLLLKKHSLNRRRKQGRSVKK